MLESLSSSGLEQLGHMLCIFCAWIFWNSQDKRLGRGKNESWQVVQLGPKQRFCITETLEEYHGCLHNMQACSIFRMLWLRCEGLDWKRPAAYLDAVRLPYVQAPHIETMAKRQAMQGSATTQILTRSGSNQLHWISSGQDLHLVGILQLQGVSLSFDV